MDMLRGAQIAEARLTDWRKLAQGLHARFLVDGFAAAAGFVAAIAEAADEVCHHPRVVIGAGHVDLELVTADLGLAPDPAAVSELELGLDTASSAGVAPFWAAVLTGDPAAQGCGTPSDEVRDATVRVPNLWFGDLEPGRDQRLHVEVYVAAEAVADRVAAAVAAGGTVVDDSQAPGLTVLADPDGNRGILCADTAAVSP